MWNKYWSIFNIIINVEQVNIISNTVSFTKRVL